MALPLYVLEAIDVRRATQSGNQRGLTLTKMGFPEIKYKTAMHNPGGGMGEVAMRLPQIEPITPKFELKGVDADILRSLGFAGGIADKWTFAGAYRDKQSSRLVPCRAIIQGIVSTYTPDEHSAGDLNGCNYEMVEVMHYEFHFDGEELWYWDFFERVNRSGGVDAFADVRNAVGG